MKQMILAVIALQLMNTSYAATGGELDNENGVVNAEQRNLAANLPATVVVRVDTRDNTVSVLQSKEVIGKDQAASVVSASFQPMQASEKLELDQNSSTSGWYFYFNYYNYSYPSYYYYGYNYSYQPYYTYNYGYYNYYYYWWRQ